MANIPVGDGCIKARKSPQKRTENQITRPKRRKMRGYRQCWVMVSQISPTVIASATLAKREIEIMLGLDITNKRVNDGS